MKLLDGLVFVKSKGVGFAMTNLRRCRVFSRVLTLLLICVISAGCARGRRGTVSSVRPQAEATRESETQGALYCDFHFPIPPCFVPHIREKQPEDKPVSGMRSLSLPPVLRFPVSIPIRDQCPCENKHNFHSLLSGATI